jgi:uncharacterized Zn-finger protein
MSLDPNHSKCPANEVESSVPTVETSRAIVLTPSNNPDATDAAPMRVFLECKEPNCGSKFKSQSHLIQHERMHTGEKPHGCPYPYCLKKFSRRDNMVQHYGVHRSQEQMMQHQAINHRVGHYQLSA